VSLRQEGSNRVQERNRDRPRRGSLRTTNQPEQWYKKLKRRTRVATLFPNEASLLRLAEAALIETDEEWETEKIYLTLETK